MQKLDYPNPAFIREATETVNDGWEICLDGATWQDIRVPFCPESKLSGVGYTDFIPHCTYRKTLTVQKTDKRIVLHFGAVDYRCELYCNGRYIGGHVGGFTPFAFDITDFAADGDNRLTLEVFDNEQRKCPTGKQSHKCKSFGCFYTRTTGIWQDVWIEYVPQHFVKAVYCTPHVDRASMTVDVLASACGAARVDVTYEGRTVGTWSGQVEYRRAVEIELTETHLWEVGCGALYDVTVTFERDTVYAYFGLREVGYRGLDFVLNGKPVYQKLVLDQGYYPDGIMTAPSVKHMENDIRLGLELGFNGARLHQKVFDPRYLYLCDKAGYMVWGEFPSWGVDYSDLGFLGRFLAEWQEAMLRDCNHPSIVAWCPLNEVWGTWEDGKEKRDVRFVDAVYAFTKSLDPSRPCIDVSGGHHGHATDCFDFHCYADDRELKPYLDALDRSATLDVPRLYCEGENLRYAVGLPTHLSECGGFGLLDKSDAAVETANEGAAENEKSWGYGTGAKDGDAFVARYAALIQTIDACKTLHGFCYTQLYDVEQEENGFYRYDRTDKLTQTQKSGIRKINDEFRRK